MGNNSSVGKDIAMVNLSGHLAFASEMAKQFGNTTLISKIFSVTDGIISGVFDKNGNPDKGMESVIGTAVVAWEMGAIGGEYGAKIGRFVPIIGGIPIFAVIGATTGAVLGAFFADDIFDLSADGYSKLLDFANEIVKDATIENGQITSLTDTERQGLANMINNGDLSALLYPSHRTKGNLSSTLGNYDKTTDPLILDLNGDGVQTINLYDSDIFFDFNNTTNMKTNTGWISKEDGFLVYDRNSNLTGFAKF
ncbi:hypothetical protein [Campylobacter hyointestinalis]|uniref:hypothetical protein n=1 Tax=Campylobacter hyointestinalis TaxID=198 RepID=UPI00072723B6|nr:hypothetical protein [Campylobacter hyointestinalis]CUU77667.1 Uncharacterised protein [Campylobacter hyointestinalis subsp. hyointestinalis]CUU77762.1 Uncharacterised protein [Campylobacter hyointestinalis subsp. hyointestinalis]